MATTVTIDGIFESIPSNVGIINNVVPKVLGTTTFESLLSDPTFTSGIPKIFYQGIFDCDVGYQAPVISSTIKPDWRHPERKIG